MATDAQGANSRTGALFTCVLFNSLVSLAELPNALRGRRMLQKHKSYAMFHPAAAHIATVASDIPIAFVQVCYSTNIRDLANIFGRLLCSVFVLTGSSG